MLYDSNLVIEFNDETWIRVVEENKRIYCLNNSQQIFFEQPNQCYKFIELSIGKKTIQQVVYNSSFGNKIIYSNEEKEQEQEQQEAANTLLNLYKN